MTASQVIYLVQQERNLAGIWSTFSREEKTEVIKRAENVDADQLEKILLEVKTGQNRLF